MHHFFDKIENRAGDGLSGYFARVINRTNQNTVAISSDENGTPIVVVSGVENMAKTDDLGNISLYVEPGTYHLDIYAPNTTSFLFRVSDVAMNSSKGDAGPAGPEGPAGEGLEDVMANGGADLVGFDGRPVGAKLREFANVSDVRFAGGARPDRTAAENTACFNAALAEALVVDVPAGVFNVLNINMPDRRKLRGAGMMNWEPYDGVTVPAGKTVLIVTGGDAINARGSNNAEVWDMGIRSLNGTQSAYRFTPGFQTGTGGIAITGSTAFKARNVSFFGLEYGIHSHLTTTALPGGGTVSGVESDENLNSANVTQMPSVLGWQASDCYRVFKFGNAASTLYASRDSHISQETVALHCGGICEIHKADGFRIGDVRLYQCIDDTIYIRGSIFIDIAGTLFEGANASINLVSCESSKVDVTTARTGLYAAPVSGLQPQRTAVKLTNCKTTRLTGILEKPTGKALDMSGCEGTLVEVICNTPFWQTGNASNASGAFNVATSTQTLINASVTGDNHQVNVWSDSASEATLTGRVVGPLATGNTRASHLQSSNTFEYQFTAPLEISPGGTSATVATIRLPIPAGKTLITRCVQIEGAPAQLRIGAGFWNAAFSTGEVHGGSIALDDKAIQNNATAQTIWSAADVMLYNPPGGSTITIPAGAKIKIAMALTS